MIEWTRRKQFWQPPPTKNWWRQKTSIRSSREKNTCLSKKTRFKLFSPTRRMQIENSASDFSTDRQNNSSLSLKKLPRSSNLFHQIVAFSNILHFSWECSAGDVESSFDNPSDILSKEGQKNFHHCPGETQHSFLTKPINSNCFLGHVRRQFDNSAEKAEKFVSLSQIDEFVHFFPEEIL